MRGRRKRRRRKRWEPMGRSLATGRVMQVNSNEQQQNKHIVTFFPAWLKPEVIIRHY